METSVTTPLSADAQGMIALLGNTMSVDKSIRDAASKQLLEMLVANIAAFKALWEVTCNSNVDAAVRLAAALAIKNRFTHSDEDVPAECEEFLRGEIVRGVVVTTGPTRKTILTLFSVLARGNLWEALPASIAPLLGARDTLAAGIALLKTVVVALNVGTSAARLETRAAWQNEFMPPVLGIFRQVIPTVTATTPEAIAALQVDETAAAVTGAIVRVFENVVMRVPSTSLTADNCAGLREWMHLLSTLLLGAPDQPEKLIGAQTHAMSAFRNLIKTVRSVAKHGAAKAVDYGSVVLRDLAPGMFHIAKRLLERETTAEMPSKYTFELLALTEELVGMRSKAIYKLATEPETLALLVDKVVLRYFAWTDDEATLFKRDPRRFFTQSQDTLFDVLSTRSAAGSLLKALVATDHAWQTRQPLEYALTAMNRLVAQYRATDVTTLTADAAEELYRSLDAALFGLSVIARPLSSTPVSTESKKVVRARSKMPSLAPAAAVPEDNTPTNMFDLLLAQMLSTVIPLLTAAHPLIRVSACRSLVVLIGLADLDTPPPGVAEQFPELIRGLLAVTEDASNLPARGYSAQVMRIIVTRDPPQITDWLRPYAKPLVTVYITLFSELEVGDLAACVASMVAYFPRELVGFVLDILRRLCERFIECAKKAAEAFKEAEETEFSGKTASLLELPGLNAEDTALQTIIAITTILNTLGDFPQVVRDAELIIAPFLEATLLPSDDEFSDKLLGLLGTMVYMTYCVDLKPSLRMWMLFGRLVSVYGAQRAEVLSLKDILVPVDNFLSADIVAFCRGPEGWPAGQPTPMELALDICESAEEDAMDVPQVLNLIETLLHNARGTDPVLLTAGNHFRRSFECLVRIMKGRHAKDFVDRTRVVLGDFFWCAPGELLRVLDDLSRTADEKLRVDPIELLREWFKWVATTLGPDAMEEGFEKKVSAVGMTSLLGALAELPAFPPGLFASASDLTAVAGLVVRLICETFSLQKEEEERGSDYDEDSDSDASEVDGPQAAEGLDDAALCDAVRQQAAGGPAAPAPADDDSSFGFGGSESDAVFSSPLDNVNEAVYFEEVAQRIVERAQSHPGTPAEAVSAAVTAAVAPVAEQVAAAIAYGKSRIAIALKEREEEKAKAAERALGFEHRQL